MKIWLRLGFGLMASLFALVPISAPVLAYEIHTHAALTQEIIKFYNEKFPAGKISDELKSFAIDGSRREDDPPRWMNHFYDPVHYRGLESVYGNGVKSGDWAQDENAQIALKYNPAIGTILASVQQGKMEKFLPTSDFTWQAGIRYYVNGNVEMAMFSLGHVLHLLEDMSVPDHTRNDPHPAFTERDLLGTGSPYELWAGKFNSDNLDLSDKVLNKSPIILSDLNSYFNELAKYSNNNFYSKNTIGTGEYSSPEPDYFAKDSDGHVYGLRYDIEFGDYHVIKANGVLAWAQNGKELINYDPILRDYWDRLSVKAVQYGSGVINLFFREAEKAKNDPNFVKEFKQSLFAETVNAVTNFSSNVLGKISSLIGGGVDDNPVEVADLRARQDNTFDVPVPAVNHRGYSPKTSMIAEDDQKTNIIPENDADVAINHDAPTNDSSSPRDESPSQPSRETRDAASESNAAKPITSPRAATVPPTVSARNCSFKDGDGKAPSLSGMIINEVAWMGTTTSASNEWIELKNISPNAVNIGGWQLVNARDEIKIKFGNETVVGVSSPFFLLERTDDDTVPGIKADFIYVGALSNVSDGLRLFDDACNLIDEAVASPDWPAGDVARKISMERSADFSWHTYNGSGTGTPKAENSLALAVINDRNNNSGGGNGSVAAAPQPAPRAAMAETKICSSSESLLSAHGGIIINEVAWMGTSAGASNEWIELKNISSQDIFLADWQLLDEDRQIKIIFSPNEKISSGGFYLLERTDDNTVPGIAADKIYTGSLENSNEVLSLFDGHCGLVDEVGAKPDWPAGNNSLKRSMERKDDLSWVTYDGGGINGVLGTPRAENNTTQSASASSTAANILENAGNHLLISEIYPDQTGGNKDFIEIYNPTSSTAPLDGWSLEVLKNNASGTVSRNIDFTSGTALSSRGYFLIGIDDYSASVLPQPDLTWPSGFLNTRGGANVVLYFGEDIIDEAGYDIGNATSTALSVGQSLERKSFVNGECIAPTGELDRNNNCDTDSVSDFMRQDNPNPRNSRGLFKVPNFRADFVSSSMLAELNWDFLSATPESAIYEISYSYENSTETPIFVASTTNISSSVVIKEVGDNYIFYINALSGKGALLGQATTSLSVPDFLNSLFTYPSPTQSSTYVMDLRYNSYPFLPDLYDSGSREDKYKILVFYLNQTAGRKDILSAADNFEPDSGALAVQYARCAGYRATEKRLMIPGKNSECLSGSYYDNSLEYGAYLNSRLTFNVLFPREPKTDDYITVAYYSRKSNESTVPEFHLIASDRRKFYFQNNPPPSQVPSNPSSLLANVDVQNKIARLSWMASIDLDSPDIAYEINLASGTDPAVLSLGDNWKTASPLRLSGDDPNLFRYNIPMEDGLYYKFAVRAVDEMNNHSNPAVADFSLR